MSETDRQAICQAISILVAAGIVDYNGHVSIRCLEGGFFINSGASNRAAMTPAQVILVDDAGNQMEDARPPNEVAMHAALYAARPDVQAVIHGHPKWTTLFTATSSALPVVMPQGALVDGLPVYPESHSISTPERGMAVAHLLAGGRGVLLRSHGSVFAGGDVVEATALAIYAEQNAERAYMARALGEAVPLPESECAEYRRTLDNPGLFKKCWDFHLP